MLIFGLPLWLLLLIAIIVIFIGWKLVKFALTLLIFLIMALALFMIADLVWPYIEPLL